MDTEQLEQLRGQYGIFTPEAFPIYYQKSAQFVLDSGQPSGVRGATAQVLIEFNTNPHIIYGVRITNTYELPADVDPLARFALKATDDEQSIRVEFAQQNISADRIAQASLQGGMAAFHWHPFPKPYYLRGANQLRVNAIRTQSYPTLAAGEFIIAPTLQVTAVCAVLVDDARTRAAPGSTGRP